MVSKDNADIVRDWLALDPRADWEATPDDFGEVVAALDALVAERDEARRLEFVRLGEAQQANELRLAAEAARDEALKRIALETQGMRDSRGGHMKRDPSYDALNREREEAFADAARWRARTHAAEADLADALHEAADMTAGQTAALARAEAAEAALQIVPLDKWEKLANGDIMDLIDVDTMLAFLSAARAALTDKNE